MGGVQRGGDLLAMLCSLLGGGGGGVHEHLFIMCDTTINKIKGHSWCSYYSDPNEGLGLNPVLITKGPKI